MMDNKLVGKFMRQVNEVFTSERDKDAVFEALKRYQSSSDVKRLVQDLKRTCNEPTKLEIYDYLRPLIRPQHQQSYDKMAPAAPGQRLRVIRLRRRANESFGFAVRGGFEHGIGVFVSHVQPGSQADQKGLKMGDEIVRVNGFTIAEAIHEEVLNLIKGRDEIELKVTNIGMVPIKQNPTDPVTWQYVDKAGNTKQQAKGGESSEGDQEIRKIFINLRGAPGLGCSIISGPQQFPGIYVESVRPGSLGEDYKLEPGDQILEVNGTSFLGIKHKQAIVELKGSKELNMVIKKRAGLALVNLKNKSPAGSPNTMRKISAGASPRPTSEILDTDLSERQRVDAHQERQREEERKRQEREEAWRQEQEEEEEIRRQELEMQQQIQLEKERQKEKERLEREKREKEAARLKQQEEEQRKLEERKHEEAQRQKEAERRKEEERRKGEERKKEEERKRLAEKEDERRKNEALAQKRESAVLAGRLGPKVAMKPTLLGAASGSQSLASSSSSGRVIKEVKIKMVENCPLDIAVEGGAGSPLGDKIVASDVYPGGAVDLNGEIRKGDQILEVNGQPLSDMTSTEAEEFLWEAQQKTQPGGYIRFLIAESEFRASADEVSSEAPTSDLDYLDYMARHDQLNWDTDSSPITYI